MSLKIILTIVFKYLHLSSHLKSLLKPTVKFKGYAISLWARSFSIPPEYWHWYSWHCGSTVVESLLGCLTSTDEDCGLCHDKWLHVMWSAGLSLTDLRYRERWKSKYISKTINMWTQPIEYFPKDYYQGW